MNSQFSQGQGLPGRYAGLPDSFSSLRSAKIVLLPIPFDKTSTYKKGSSRGPEALIEASRNMELYDLETHSETYVNGIHTACSIQEDSSEKMLESAYQQTKEFLSQNKFTVILGGEHTVSYATIKAHADYYQSLTILQLDAHADLQLSYEGNPWSHACVMARVKELPSIVKVVSVGIRSMSKEEVPFLDQANTFFAHEIIDNELWIDKVLNKLSGPIYITIDLDVFDSALMPSTGTPEPGGLLWNQTLKLLRRVIKEKQVVGFDVVELCPIPDNHAPDYMAAKLIYKLLSYKFYKPDAKS